ncbi:MAG: 3-deoxy-D-manno-octulosonic acid kinase [Holophagaceae bacterium]|nr:3-deoxy-D-manno-octulosonic acid kinase [Holophagaceae bacterium]
MSIVPALPSIWPYDPRCPLAPLETSTVTLPGLGRGWRLEAVGGLQVPEETADLPAAFGRGGVIRAGDLVLRPYRRGGLLRFINDRTYASADRFLQELEVHRALWEAGFPTVEPLGIAHRRKGLGVEGVLLTRYVESRPWPRCWDAPGVIPALRLAIDALVSWRLWSPDLNATNVMLGNEGILLLDWDKAQWFEATDLRERYRERLIRSLRKLGAPEALILQL